MSVQRIARRYASALLQDAMAAGRIETVETDFAYILNLIDTSADFKVLLRSPVIEPSRKKAIVREIFASRGISASTLEFLELLIDKGRAGFFREVAYAMQVLLDKQRGILRADITSAVPLDEQTSTKLTQAMGKRLGATIIPTFHVDPKVLGGVAVHIGDTVMDSTLKRQLSDLQSELVA